MSVDTILIDTEPGTTGELAPGQTVSLTYQYTGEYRLLPGRANSPQVQVRLQIGTVYDSTQIVATFTSPADSSGNGTWYYNSSVPSPGGSSATITAWLYNGTTKVAGPTQVTGFTVS